MENENILLCSVTWSETFEVTVDGGDYNWFVQFKSGLVVAHWSCHMLLEECQVYYSLNNFHVAAQYFVLEAV